MVGGHREHFHDLVPGDQARDDRERPFDAFASTHAGQAGVAPFDVGIDECAHGIGVHFLQCDQQVHHPRCQLIVVQQVLRSSGIVFSHRWIHVVTVRQGLLLRETHRSILPAARSAGLNELSR